MLLLLISCVAFSFGSTDPGSYNIRANSLEGGMKEVFFKVTEVVDGQEVEIEVGGIIMPTSIMLSRGQKHHAWKEIIPLVEMMILLEKNKLMNDGILLDNDLQRSLIKSMRGYAKSLKKEGIKFDKYLEEIGVMKNV